MENPQPLSPQEAKEKILLILRDGTYKLSAHCRRDSMRARNIPRDDIISGLETGQIIRKPEWDENHQNWKYRVEGFDSDGDDITMITVIMEADLKLVIVTVW